MNRCKKILSLLLSFVMIFSLVAPNVAFGASKTTEHHLILPQDFASHMGNWSVAEYAAAFEQTTMLGLTYRNQEHLDPAVTTITIETAGDYSIWVHGMEFTNVPDQPSSWLFQVGVDGTTFETMLGGSQKEATGFVWRNAGTINLTAGTHEISLVDTYGDWPRCDAIFVTNDDTMIPSNDFATLKEQAASGGIQEDPEDENYLIIDNTAEGTAKNGPESNWATHNDAAATGGSFFAATGLGSDIVSFSWPLALDEAGYWEIEAYIPEAPEGISLGSKVNYQIVSQEGIENITIDQSAKTGWVKLGIWLFAANGSETISLAPEKNGSDWALVDALRLSYKGLTDPDSVTIVVDNEDAENTVITGAFPNSSGNGWVGSSNYREGFIGENYYSFRIGDPEASFSWKFAVPKNGYYEVSVNIPDGSTGSIDSRVVYEVYAATGTETITISQSRSKGYISLGTFYFEATDDATALLKLLGPTETVCMVDAAMIEFKGDTLTTDKGYYNINLNDPQQTILGLGVEIQSDSLGSGNTMDANDTSGHAVPHDLTESERQRFFTEMLDGFRYIRLAGGLFYRGTDAEEKHLTERWDTQDEELAEMIEVSGVEGFNLEFWSPTPYFKSNGQYHGGKLKCFDENWEFYGNEEKTNEFLIEFGETLIEDFKRMEADGLPIVQFSLQNEPDLTSVYGTYSFCYYNDNDYYKACTILLPMLKEAFPDLKIHANSWNGQHSGAAWAIKDNPEVLACVDLWSYHTVGYNSDKMIDSQSDYNYGTAGKPVFNAEFEYQPSDYTGQFEYRFVNTAQAIMNWMVFENSPTWYWLHALKPLGNEESLGYSLGMWRKSGDTTNYSFSTDEQSDYWNSVEEKTWAYNYPNYNALRGFLEFMPWDSVRYSVEEDEVRKDQRIMAWKTPEGRLAFALTNRDSNNPFTFSVDTGLENTSFKGYALTAYSEKMIELGTKSGSTIETALDAYSVQFWVAEEDESMTPANGIEISESELTLELGATAQLNATVLPANAANKNVRWTSSDSTIATVDDNGVVTALKEGVVTITATAVSGNGRYSADCVVEISEDAASLKVTFVDSTGATIKTIKVATGEAIEESLVPAAPGRYGYIFIGWSYDTNIPVFADMVISALYEKDTTKTYTITFPEGTSTSFPEGQTTFYYNDRVKFKAPRLKDGKEFSYWKANGGIFSFSKKTSFLTFGNIELEAVYGEEPENDFIIFTDSKPTITDHEDTAKYDMHVMGVVSTAGKEVSEIGVYLAAGEYTAEEMTNGTATTVKLVASKAVNDRQFVYTIKNIAYDKARTAIVYAVIDGVTYYSDTSCTALITSDDNNYDGDEIVDHEKEDPFG